MTLDSLIYAIERHCNNYFNPQNDPASTERGYPPHFTELAGRILAYINDSPGNVASFSNQNYGESYTGESWQKAFSGELSLYRRARLL